MCVLYSAIRKLTFELRCSTSPHRYHLIGVWLTPLTPLLSVPSSRQLKLSVGRKWSSNLVCVSGADFTFFLSFPLPFSATAAKLKGQRARRQISRSLDKVRQISEKGCKAWRLVVSDTLVCSHFGLLYLRWRRSTQLSTSVLRCKRPDCSHGHGPTWMMIDFVRDSQLTQLSWCFSFTKCRRRRWMRNCASKLVPCLRECLSRRVYHWLSGCTTTQSHTSPLGVNYSASRQERDSRQKGKHKQIRRTNESASDQRMSWENDAQWESEVHCCWFAEE